MACSIRPIPPAVRFNNHRLLLLGFTAFEDLPRHMRKGDLPGPGRPAPSPMPRFARISRAEVAEARPERLILSSETLFRPLRAQGPRGAEGGPRPLRPGDGGGLPAPALGLLPLGAAAAPEGLPQGERAAGPADPAGAQRLSPRLRRRGGPAAESTTAPAGRGRHHGRLPRRPPARQRAGRRRPRPGAAQQRDAERRVHGPAARVPRGLPRSEDNVPSDDPRAPCCARPRADRRGPAGAAAEAAARDRRDDRLRPPRPADPARRLGPDLPRDSTTTGSRGAASTTAASRRCCATGCGPGGSTRSCRSTGSCSARSSTGSPAAAGPARIPARARWIAELRASRRRPA